jgi:tRNA A-37 threonylcarbamoyl transferase component Bud32
MSFIKTIVYDENKTRKDAELEIELQNISASHGFSPKILNTTFDDDKCVIEMEDLGDECVFDNYGDDPAVVPEDIWNKIRHILNTLLEEEAIEYVDISPYNFIEKDGKMYVVDFGDAYYSDEKIGDGYINEFLDDFLDGDNEWNPDFF